MKYYLGFLLLFVSVTSFAQTEVGRVYIPADAQDIQMDDFFETTVPSGPGHSDVPGYSLRMFMTSYTEGDCDPEAPAGAAGSCSEPRDLEKDVLIRADLLPAVPKLSKWSNNLKIAKKFLDFKVIAAAPGASSLQLIVSRKNQIFSLQLRQTDLPSFNYCSGYNTVTGSTVNGSCSNGIVRAYDLQTGAMVSGTCQANGTFYGYEIGTGANVYGSCQ